MEAAEQAQAWHRLGYNCAQAVLCALAASLGVDERLAKLLASGFGGGMGREQLTCGAAAGAVMALGARYFDTEDVLGSKERVYAKTREFLRRFREANGGLSCRELLGVDISAPEGLERARAENLFQLRCEPYMMSACRIVEAMLREE